MIVPNPEAAYDLCSDYIPDCLNSDDHQSDVGYRGMDEDDIINREGLTPLEYLEITERFIPDNETVPAVRNETVRKKLFFPYLISYFRFTIFMWSQNTDIQITRGKARGWNANWGWIWLDREGLTLLEYLEITERFIPDNETVPAVRNETVRKKICFSLIQFHMKL